MLTARADVKINWWADHSTESANHGLDVSYSLRRKVAAHVQHFRWQCLELSDLDRIRRDSDPLFPLNSGPSGWLPFTIAGQESDYGTRIQNREQVVAYSEG